jgi:hypothetical protein
MTNMPHEIKVGDVYQTRNDLTARIVATDKQGNNYPIVALVKGKPDDHEIIIVYSRDGHPATMSPIGHGADLIFPDPYEDWKINDPIWVWNSPRMAFPRHFAGVGPDGEVYAWRDGFTSHTTDEREPRAAWRFASKTRPAMAVKTQEDIL